MRRVIVTGARDLADYEIVANELWKQAGIAGGPNKLIVVQGKCPYGGADLHAENWADEHGAISDPYAADWKKHGKAAGPVRNSAMVADGADVVLAFPRGVARGTMDCVDKARAAKIPVLFG